MSTQPEALLFADRLEAADKRYCMPMLHRAAAELRRLHAENEALSAQHEAAKEHAAAWPADWGVWARPMIATAGEKAAISSPPGLTS